jgi:EmrB/QacA subfamily drug resistance transporter
MNFRIIFAIAIGMFVTNLDATILNIAFPTLAVKFNVGTGRISLIELGYLITLCTFLPVFAKIGEKKGTVYILRWGYVVFIATTVLCGLSPDLITLIILRSAQGIGGAMLLSVGNSLIVQHIPAEFRGRAYGINTLLGGVGFALGSPVGGFLTYHFGWRSVFFVSIIPAIAGLLLARKYLENKGSERTAVPKFDISGSVIFFICLATLIFILNSGHHFGLTSIPIMAAAGVLVISLACFIANEKRATDPLINLSLFKNKNITLGLYAGMAAVVILDGMSFLFPFYFENIRGFSTVKAGLILGSFPLLTLFFSPLSGWLVDRFDARLVCAGSGSLLVLSTFLFSYFDSTAGLVNIFVAFIIFAIGLSLFLTANTALVMGHSHDGSENTLSALYSLIQTLGSAIGVAGFEMAYSLHISNPDTPVNAIPVNVLSEGFRVASITACAFSVSLFVVSLIARADKNEKLPVHGLAIKEAVK